MSNYDVIVYGATSFVGQLLTQYLLNRHGVNRELRWAIAGRNPTKLNDLRQSLGSQAKNLAILLADADDESSLLAMCQQTKVIVSTVGPYAQYGSTLVKVCAQSGTDYCDLTGEPQWIARMLDAYEADAKASGARIIHCCGFDSVPSDLGTYYLQQQAQQQFGQACSRVKLRVKAIKGGMSGGTVGSMVGLIKEAASDAALRKLLANPYALCPRDGSNKPKQPNLQFAEFDEDAQSWAAPFIMAGINTKVVHRSNALSQYAYGTDFVYDETMLTKKGFAGGAMAVGAAVGLGCFVSAVALPPTRHLLEKFVLPKAGEGPTPQQQERGFYDIRLLGSTANGQRLQAKVTGDRDPGYGSTAKILGEAAVCLALDMDKNALDGGFWTPATAMGNKLIDRLGTYAGLSFSLV
ncbi:MAG TPA: saccharopine dehydrogenase NADP-binding domain-containing protein [Agitococcus sp.]|nr:saccharopine dehydrogenase NADP-binding domain-containing protein [Agitococcus sp.]